MKALRYLLIVMGLMSVLSISAQALAQQPQAQMFRSGSGNVRNRNNDWNVHSR